MFCDLVGKQGYRLLTSISGGGSKFHSQMALGKCHITGGVDGWYNQVEWMMLSGVFVGKVVIIMIRYKDKTSLLVLRGLS